MANNLSNPQLPNYRTPPPLQDHVKDHEKRLEAELKQLQLDIVRIGNPQESHCLFGELFDDDEAQQYYEALVGTLKSAKKRKLVNFKGQMLLKGMHDDVRISLVQQQVPSLTESQSLSSELESTEPKGAEEAAAAPPSPQCTPPRWKKNDFRSENSDQSPEPSSYNMKDMSAALPPPLPSLDQAQKQGTSLNVSKRTPPRWTRKTAVPSTGNTQHNKATPDSLPMSSSPVPQRASTPPPSTEKHAMDLGTPPRRSFQSAQSPLVAHQTPPRPPSRGTVSTFKTPPRASNHAMKNQSPSSVESSPGRLRIPNAFCASDSEGESSSFAASPRRQVGRLSPCGAWSDSEMVVTRKKNQQDQTKDGPLNSTSEHRRIKSNVSERWTKLFQEHSPTKRNKKELETRRKLRRKSSGSSEKSGSFRKANDKTKVSPAQKPNGSGKSKKETINYADSSSRKKEGKSKAAVVPIKSQPDKSANSESTCSPKRMTGLSMPKPQQGQVAARSHPKRKFRASMVESRVGKLDTSGGASGLSRAESQKALTHSNSFVRVDEEVQQLLKDIARLSTAEEEGKASVPFGVLFTDDVVQNTYEALVGTLRSAKRKGLIAYDGQFLLKGVHDDVLIKVV